MELRGGGPTAPSLFALGEARRVAHALGATVYAFVTAGDLAPAALDDLATRLGGAGADKLLCCQDPSLDGPPLDATHGRALALAAERITPVLFLLPAGSVGPELGPRLAARLNGAYAPAADVELRGDVLTLVRWRAAGDAYRRLDPAEVERPIVATMGSARPRGPTGGDEAEVEMLSLPEAATAPSTAVVVELWSREDDVASVELAHGLVVLGHGVGAAALAALRRAAPDGVAVAPDRDDTRGALATATPAFVLALASDAWVGATPSTRRGEIRPARADGASTADFVWTVEDDAATAELCRALGAAGGARP